MMSTRRNRDSGHPDRGLQQKRPQANFRMHHFFVDSMKRWCPEACGLPDVIWSCRRTHNRSQPWRWTPVTFGSNLDRDLDNSLRLDPFATMLLQHRVAQGQGKSPLFQAQCKISANGKGRQLLETLMTTVSPAADGSTIMALEHTCSIITHWGHRCLSLVQWRTEKMTSSKRRRCKRWVWNPALFHLCLLERRRNQRRQHRKVANALQYQLGESR
mmetsp:Transcript_64381/g.153556  ORF Transcript_64381/g.153556 Transcript_64381/m.153556 type:complete len:215 (+) Transcript_64381:1450-2094(+)